MTECAKPFFGFEICDLRTFFGFEIVVTFLGERFWSGLFWRLTKSETQGSGFYVKQ